MRKNGGLKCPVCEYRGSGVSHTRMGYEAKPRERVCYRCGTVYETRERVSKVLKLGSGANRYQKTAQAEK